MKILIGCDVDPVLPPLLRRRPDRDPWLALRGIDELLKLAGAALPPITWLIRADASVDFSTGNFASGYLTRKGLWEDLLEHGHELGWHMHLMSHDAPSGCFRFDPSPAWLSQAHESLARHFPVRASRTGWNYGSNRLFQSLDGLGIAVDFSALPGNKMRFDLGKDLVDVDWLRCAPGAYHPNAHDYQRPGGNPLNMLEMPITQFTNSLWGMIQRSGRRVSQGRRPWEGLKNKTLLMTQAWPVLPKLETETLAFFFHPDDLTEAGIANFIRNVESLKRLPGAEFIVASEVES